MITISLQNMNVTAGTRLGPYQIVSRIGAGGMGEVWRARDTRLDRSVAVKILLGEYATNPQLKLRFEREARAISQLNHPNICTLHDVGEGYLVMELIDGESLAQRIERGPLPIPEVLKYGAQVAGALDRAHRAGIVHRDLKPGNVMIAKSGVKLLDFGLARQTGLSLMTSNAPTVPRPITAEGTIVGTLQYMSPEQLEGKPTDARTDIFSLGCMLYEMVTGSRAFSGSNQASIISAILTSEPRLLSELQPLTPRALEHLIVRCLMKDPDERWQCAADIAYELRWLAGMGPETGTPEAAQSSTRQFRRWRTGTAVLALLLLAALGAAMWLGRYTLGLAKPAAAPVPKLVRLTWEPGDQGQPSISPDGTNFVYTSWTTGNAAICVRRIGGENPINLTRDTSESNSQPAFSPDGQSIAFRSERDGGGIFIMGATGESVRRLTDFGYKPAWSPDGKSIALSTLSFESAATALKGEIWVVDVTSGARRKIYDGTAMSATWSPLGTRIAFAGERGHALDQDSVWTIPSSGGQPVEVVSLPTRVSAHPAWTRGWIWFSCPTEGAPGIWRVRVDDTTGARIAPPEAVLRQTSTTEWPSVSADGERLIFTSVLSRTTSVVRHEFDAARGHASAEPQTILAGARGLVVGNPSPDGQWLATTLVELDGQWDIVLVRTSNGETRRLTNDALLEDPPTWARDGSKLYFTVPHAGKWEVWSIRPDGSGRELVVTSSSTDVFDSPMPSPDGRELYVSVWAAGKTIKPYRVDVSVPIAQRRLIPIPPVSETRIFSYRDWSPDGRWIVGYAADDHGNSDPGLMIFDVAQKTYRKLADLKPDVGCTFLADSRRIVLASDAAPASGTATEIRLLDRETGAVSPVGTVKAAIRSVSRDGRWLFANKVDAEGKADIWMLDYRAKP